MAYPPRNRLVGTLAALALTCCAQPLLGVGAARAQPPAPSGLTRVALAARAVASFAATQRAEARVTTRPADAAPPATSDAADVRARRAQPAAQAPRLSPLPSRFEQLAGPHAKRAMQVAQGVPAGRVALRPMFWMTRDQRGGMVALGGRF